MDKDGDINIPRPYFPTHTVEGHHLLAPLANLHRGPLLPITTSIATNENGDFNIPRPYFPTHTVEGHHLLAPPGNPHQGPLPGIRSLDLPANFPPRQTSLPVREKGLNS
jgi:hypothetical protein